MSFVRKFMRYAHAEGHTDVCYIKNGDHLLTCGSDGDVRTWSGIEDDDPSSECVGELALAVASWGDRFFVGTDSNYVQAYTFPDVKRDGVISRFSAPVTHIAVSEDGSKIASCACDMEVQVTEVASGKTTKFSGHTAPILSIALDPKDKYVVSASCDGSVKVWDVASGTSVKTFANIVPVSNDFFRATSLARGSWQPERGSMLALPKDKVVQLYERDTWSLKEELSHPQITKMLSVAVYSPCGSYLAAASVAGEIVVWDVSKQKTVSYTEHPKKAAITGLAWHPEGKEIMFCDALGQLGLLERGQEPAECPPAVSATADDVVSDDDNSISLRDIKASAGWMSPGGPEPRGDDEASTARDDDQESRSEMEVRRPPTADLQPPFQPSSTPAHFQHRFMTWNSIGIVRCFNTEEEKSVDVEFHDTVFHHALHINNYSDYTTASLSDKVLALACLPTEETPSKLTCIMLNAWDGSKEWSVCMPEGESVLAVAAAGTWVAAATDRHFLRLYTHAGTQRQVVSLPGPVVSMAGHQRRLLVAFHSGIGVTGCQSLGYMLLEVGPVHVRAVHPASVLPLSPASNLKWVGFTDEGTPCVMDSAGVLHGQPGGSALWTVACDTTLHRRSPSDHYFVIGVSERYQNLRCILCKGSYYPQTTPRPTVVEIALRLPLCDPDSDKTGLEEVFWRSLSVLPAVRSAAVNNAEFRADLDELEKTLKQTAIKLFANACRSDSDVRATDVASLMTAQPLQMAAKYASKVGKMYLAERLSSLAPIDWTADCGPAEEPPTSSYDSHTRVRILSQQDLFEESPPVPPEDNRLLAAERESEDHFGNSTITPITPGCINPFKRKQKCEGGPKGLTFFDSAQLPTKPKPEAKTVEKLTKSKTSKNDSTPGGQKKPTFIQWFNLHKADLKDEFPHLSITELTKAAMNRFREENSAQQENTMPSKTLDPDPTEQKKRRGDRDIDSSNEPAIKKTTAHKLSSFAFKK